MAKPCTHSVCVCGADYTAQWQAYYAQWYGWAPPAPQGWASPPGAQPAYDYSAAAYAQQHYSAAAAQQLPSFAPGTPQAPVLPHAPSLQCMPIVLLIRTCLLTLRGAVTPAPSSQRRIWERRKIVKEFVDTPSADQGHAPQNLPLLHGEEGQDDRGGEEEFPQCHSHALAGGRKVQPCSGTGGAVRANGEPVCGAHGALLRAAPIRLPRSTAPGTGALRSHPTYVLE